MKILAPAVGSIMVCFASASVFVPHSARDTQLGISSNWSSSQSSRSSQINRHKLRAAARSAARQTTSGEVAMAIPGYGVAEQVFIGGFSNFLSIYNLIITGRILLSWFPQAQSIGALQPVYAITDPYLNLFRGIIPPIFGLDFSPILAFLLLNVVTSVRTC
jgi:uncharacterized protein YggT (Ycf19 family)